jgi:uncharacterized protein
LTKINKYKRMKNKISKLLYILLVITFIIPSTLLAQKNKNTFSTLLKGTYNIKPNKISLRWNVSNYNKMEYLATNGVVIDRLILDATKKETKAWERITAAPIKALSKEALQVGMKAKDTGMAVIFKCLYDKTNYPKVNFVEDAQNQDMDAQNRFFILALFASKNPKTAEAAGLGYDDVMTVDSTKSYVYRISMANDDKTVAAAFIYVYGKTLNEKKVFEGVRAEGKDRAITISWKASAIDDYNGFWIERSKGNSSYERLNKTLYVPSYDTARNYQFYTDSVMNYTNYTYRVAGLNSFGELLYSNITEKTMAKDLTAPEAPFMKAELKKEMITIKWNKPFDKDLSGYYITYGKKSNGTDSLLTKEILKPSVTEYSFKKPANFKFAYYRIMAIDTAKNYSFSNTSYVFVVDNTPPKPPVGLKGVINDKGIVKLHWEVDSTDAIMGYKVFFANQENHVFSALSNIIDKDNYIDTAQLKTLTEYIYYKVVAVDQNYNHSDFSEVLKLKRPLKNKPSEPVILDYKVTYNKVQFNWSPVSESAVMNYQVYRRKAGETKWNMLTTTTNTSFKDTAATENTEWEYSVMAVDENKLQSTNAFALAVKTGAKLKVDKIKIIKTTVENDKKIMVLQWTKSNYAVKRTMIYKKVNNDFILSSSVDKDKINYALSKDEATTKFAIRFFYDDGTESELFYE